MGNGLTYDDIVESNKQVMIELDVIKKLLTKHKDDEINKTQKFFSKGIIMGALFSFVGGTLASCLYYLKSTYGGGDNLFWDVFTFGCLFIVFLFMFYLVSSSGYKTDEK